MLSLLRNWFKKDFQEEVFVKPLESKEGDTKIVRKEYGDGSVTYEPKVCLYRWDYNKRVGTVFPTFGSTATYTNAKSLEECREFIATYEQQRLAAKLVSETVVSKEFEERRVINK